MRAFTLRADITDFSGGSIALPPDGRTLDVQRRLGDSGVIVVSDEVEANALADFPHLKELDGSERDEAVAAHGQSTAEAEEKRQAEEPTKADLVARAEKLGVATSGTKADIQARIAEAESDKGGDD